MSTLCIGFVGRSVQKKYRRIHYATAYTILEVIFKNGGHFQSNTTYLGKYETENRHSSIYIISFMPNIIQIAHCYVYDKNCGHNLTECCGYLF